MGYLDERKSQLETEIATLEERRQEHATLLNDMLIDMNAKLKRIEERARNERGVNFVYTDEEKEMIGNIKAEYEDKKEQVISRAKRIVEDLDTKKSWLENDKNSIQTEKADAEKRAFNSDLNLIRNEMGKFFEDFKWEGATLNGGAVSTTAKTVSELRAEYQSLLAEVDQMREDGKIDMRKASELKLAIARTVDRYSKNAPQQSVQKKPVDEQEEKGQAQQKKYDFKEELKQQVNDMREQIEKEIKDGDLDKEGKKREDDHKVEKTDDDYIM